ncbi:MAG: hypothetical protein R3A44_23640 [Caldilineaceae bacterium]
MKSTNKPTLWLRWVLANAVGEMLGLGATFAVLAFFSINLGNRSGVLVVLLSFLVAVFSGVLEATVIGLAQWWAMHPWFPAIGRRTWWIATLIGALVAYVLGYLPSTLMDLGAEAGAELVPEPPQWPVLLLAAGMGAVGGAVLSFAQWWVVRGKVDRAAWWMPANMLAWLVGMPIIFWAIDAAQKGQPPLQAGLLLAAALLVTGAVVGAIHGAFLVRLAPSAAS